MPDTPAPSSVRSPALQAPQALAGSDHPPAIEVVPRPTVRRGALLFTAFEPSGDDHASAVIAELKRRHPELPIFAWGGPKMRAAGATVIEATGEDAVMGVPGLYKVIEHLRINRRIDAFLKENARSDTPIVAHVPVDSPAANTPICKIARRHGLRIVHLVAPQIWAWGRWRIGKLRRLTDFVLCLLPFEEEFFTKRNVPAKFIGHFLFDKRPNPAEVEARAANFGSGHPRIAMMPGSRPDEVRRHLPVLLQAYKQLLVSFPNASAVIAATNDATAQRIRTIGLDSEAGFPESLRIVTGDTDGVIHWCDIALVKSGTVTLQVARDRRPMIVFYRKSGPLFYVIAKAVVSTKLFSLPNVIARRRVVPELVPHYGGAGPIVALAEQLLHEPERAKEQVETMAKVLEPFEGLHASQLAAEEIVRVSRVLEAVAEKA